MGYFSSHSCLFVFLCFFLFISVHANGIIEDVDVDVDVDEPGEGLINTSLFQSLASYLSLPEVEKEKKKERSSSNRVQEEEEEEELLELRKDTLEIMSGGLEAVLTSDVFRRTISVIPNTHSLRIHTGHRGSIIHNGRSSPSIWHTGDYHTELVLNLDNFERVLVVGGGKAAADSAEQLEKILEAGGLLHKLHPESMVTDVVDPSTKSSLKRITLVKGTHPLPSQTNVEACERMLNLISSSSSKDLVLVLISGGGSAILSNPSSSHPEALELLIKTSSGLLRSGAEIHEMNIVRKHMSRIAGGQLSERAQEAGGQTKTKREVEIESENEVEGPRVVSLIFSDVIGNDLSIIASGPTVFDPSTLEDVDEVLRRHSGKELPFSSVEEARKLFKDDSVFRETPKDPSVFSRTTNILLLDNSHATRAMTTISKNLGYLPIVLGTELRGDSLSVAKVLQEKIDKQAEEGEREGEGKKGIAIIAAGETSVLVKGNGKGGRNQQLGLAYLIEGLDRKEEGWNSGCGIFLASDGIDNSEAAGVIVDGLTTVTDRRGEGERDVKKARKAFETCNAFPFFEKEVRMKSLIITGPTGTNVADLMLVVVSKKQLEERKKELEKKKKKNSEAEVFEIMEVDAIIM